ncbi:MAG: NUDIX domain-containing protein, partial [Candidatus Hodarchaeota archaeon]
PQSRYSPPRHLVGGGGVILHNNTVLLVKHTYGPSKDLWLFPGGLVETGETFEEALKREVQEEIGVEINPLYLISVRTMVRRRYFENDPEILNDFYILFQCEYVTGKPQPISSEISEIAFFTLDRVQKEPSAAYFVQQVLPLVLKNKRGFSLLPPDLKRMTRSGFLKDEVYMFYSNSL